ncbi:MAG: hypothetical protein ACR2PG_03700 [Hyphomicrobiaceae bacterium]
MPDRGLDKRTHSNDSAPNQARRNILVGSGAVLVGAVAGGSSASEPPASSSAASPPLPWEWAKIDPMEAATRTYHGYLNQGG